MALSDPGTLTRFYDRHFDGDGPVSGAIQLIPVVLNDAGNSDVAHARIDVPAGMEFYISDIQVRSGTITGDPQVTVGATSSGTQIVASTTLTADLAALTLKANKVPAGGLIDLRVTCDANDAATDVCFTVVGHVSAPPTTLAYRA